MPGRSPSDAVTNFLDPIQRAISCVTRTPLIISPGGRGVLGRIHSLTWDEAEPVRVEPLRPDWNPVLADSEDLFRLWATWGVGRQPDGT